MGVHDNSVVLQETPNSFIICILSIQHVKTTEIDWRIKKSFFEMLQNLSNAHVNDDKNSLMKSKRKILKKKQNNRNF